MNPSSELLAIILFVYGLAFFVVGLAIILEARPNSKLALARNLWPLAGFGFLHSGVEWLEILMVARLHEGPAVDLFPYSTARIFLLVASSLSLAWFGAALLAELGGRWRICLAIPPALFLLWSAIRLAGAFAGSAYLDQYSIYSSVWTRYLLYLPASLLSAAALAKQLPVLRNLGMPRIAADCRWAAYLFGANAFFAGLVVPSAGFFPASLLNYDTFQAAVGLPPQLFRALTALGITFFVVRVLRLFDLQERLDRERFAGQALMALEDERKRIARELHDETAQLLSSILVRLTLLDKASSMDEVRKARAELVSLSSRAAEGVRRLAMELRPPELDDLGLVEALRWYVDDFSARWGLQTRFVVDGALKDLNPAVELALYRIAQEALSNAARHAAAARVTLGLARHNGSLTLRVEDDGRGFDVEAVLASRERGIGLFGIQERAALIDGSLRLDSEPGRGTRLSVDIPVAAWEQPL